MVWVLVTPEKATEYLGCSKGNRSESRGHIASFADQMRRKKWRATPQSAIIFDDNGVLRDGHHRLYAIVESATAQWFMVARGVPDAICELLDATKTRRLADVIVLRKKFGKKGGEEAVHVNLRLAAYKALAVLEDGNCQKESSDHHEVMKRRFPCVAAFEEARGSLRVPVPIPGGKTRAMAGAYLAAIAWAWEVFPKEIGALLDALAVEDYGRAPCARLIRDIALGDEASKSSLNTLGDRRIGTMRILRVLWAHVNDESMKKQPPISAKGFEGFMNVRIDRGMTPKAIAKRMKAEQASSSAA